MDARQKEAMAEATRLTREGRLAEATAMIQQTLASPGPIWRMPDAPYAEEEAGGTPSRPAILPPPADEGIPPRQTSPGWMSRLRAFTGRSAKAPVVTHPSAYPSAPSSTERLAGQFDAFSYTNAAGTRAYRLFVPSGYDGGPLPLVVMLHGGTQDAATFATATGMNDLAEREGLLVVYPEQDRAANAGLYWNWFAPGHQRRDSGEPSLIAGITTQVMDRYDVDPARVYVAGFSAGGAMAAVMAAVYPELYAAVGVHSGLAYAAASDLPSALTAMRQGPSRPARAAAQPRPLIVFHGDRDATVAPANAAGLIGYVLAAGRTDRRPGISPATVTSRGQVPGGHAYTRTCYQDAAEATVAECWIVHEGGHNWSGGVPRGSYTDPHGPDASAEFIRFFAEHPASRPAAT